ncbi:AAA family ATPase [Pectinatus frisingensis]|uniref:AAA family ATPase n=1 Tax=Pectinatus frisingensis TaxID=865 RepID=UPI0018C4B73E|nr:ATP-binding protein [Pectinatus frisingensis]
MKIRHVSDLISYVGNKDYEMARRSIEAMIATETVNDNINNVRILKGAYQSWGSNNDKFIELPQELKKYSYSKEPSRKLSDVYLEPEIVNAVKSIIYEFTNTEKLHEAGLSPRNKILLGGLPGNGKTSLAEALSNELDMKFIKINMAEIVESHMGQSSSNIDEVFRSVNNYRKCLLFFDEVDSIGSKRSYGESTDKERTHTINQLLTDIDGLPDDILFICATNLPDVLDSALLRRFKIKLWINGPTDDAILKYIDDYQAKNNVGFGLINIKNLSGQPWSKVEDFCQNLHRNIVLDTNQTVPENIWICREA